MAESTSFIGPTVFGLLVAWASGRYVETRQWTELAAEQVGHRVVLFSIIAFLLAGLLLLVCFNERKARAAAIGPDQEETTP